MSHDKAFLMGAAGKVQGRLGWAHGTIKQLFDEYEPIITSARWCEEQEYDCIHYVMRFGKESVEEIEVLRVNKHKELPVASQLSMEDLHEVFLDKPKLRKFIESELHRVLKHLKNEYSLASLPELDI